MKPGEPHPVKPVPRSSPWSQCTTDLGTKSITLRSRWSGGTGNDTSQAGQATNDVHDDFLGLGNLIFRGSVFGSVFGWFGGLEVLCGRFLEMPSHGFGSFVEMIWWISYGFVISQTIYGLWYIYLHENYNNQLNVGKYTIDGSYGYWLIILTLRHLTSEIELIIDLHSIFETTEPPFSCWGREKKPWRKLRRIHPGRLTAGTYSHHPFRKENDLPNLHDYVAC